MSAIDSLPEYMKIFYQALLNVYTEIEEELAKEGKMYRNDYEKRSSETRKFSATAYGSYYIYIPYIYTFTWPEKAGLVKARVQMLNPYFFFSCMYM